MYKETIKKAWFSENETLSDATESNTILRSIIYQNWANSSPMLAWIWCRFPPTHEKKIGLHDGSPWPRWSQPAVTEPWPGPWLSCDLAVTEPWSYWRCCDWAVTSPWLSCDLAVTELWPRRDWAVTSPSRDWAVIIGPRSRDHRGHRELTVTICFLMGSHGTFCYLYRDGIMLSFKLMLTRIYHAVWHCLDPMN